MSTTAAEHAPAQLPEEAPKEKKDLREIIAVIVLSVTAVLTAWCGFEASKWGGEMSIAFSQASSARIAAATADGEARDARSFDLTIYAQWVDAVATGKPRLATYIQERFTPHFAVAFDDWDQSGRDLPSPLAEESYVPPGQEEAVEATATADQKYDDALAANQNGDRYSLLTVLFALVLFFTAMSGRNFPVWAARFFLVLAIVLGLGGVGLLATFPVVI
ncbi:hypothetical protein [Nocardioides insulae]|uniref:hypothetical protein n=1 Tax=Nocardioides insulae TaxID=394734 RepID=UPI0006861FD5|nr:hypothetical protein [Nocardioides insulae]